MADLDRSMTSPGHRKTDPAHAPIFLRAAAFLGLALMTISSAHAQYPSYPPPPWGYPDFYGPGPRNYPPPPGPPGDEGSYVEFPGSEGTYHTYHARPAGPLTLSDIRRRVARLGLHLVAKPRRKNDIYLAEAEDAHGTRHRVVFAADTGRIIENTKLRPFKKRDVETAHEAGAPPASRQSTSP